MNVRTAQLLLLSILSAITASAQTFEEVASLRLPDATPRSTRAVALGGASDPLGDPDMAANPATLLNIKRPMFFVQGMRSSVGATRYFQIGSAPGVEQISAGASSVSQIAAAMPVGAATIGVYYAAAPRLAGPDPLTAPPEGSGIYIPGYCGTCEFPSKPVNVPAAFERRDRRYGVAMAWERGALALGAGVEMQVVRQETQTVNALLVTRPPFVFPQDERNSLLTDGRAIVPNLGMRWRVTPQLAVAAAYNGAGSFTRTWRVCGTDHIDAPICSSGYREVVSTRSRMPDAYRAGLSFNATERLRLVGEAVRRKWSRTAEHGRSVFGEFQPYQGYTDTTELHAGAEYKLSSVSLRAGWWRDPGHDDFGVPEIWQSVTHRTVGAGINVGAARLDLAYDNASRPEYRRAVVGLTFGL